MQNGEISDIPFNEGISPTSVLGVIDNKNVLRSLNQESSSKSVYVFILQGYFIEYIYIPKMHR